MAIIDEQGRPEPPVAGTEVETLVAYLDYQRATFEWKCRGVDSGGLAAATGVSSLTLGGLQKHLALVEQQWFSRWLADEEWRAPFAAVDWSATPDWEFESAADDSPAELMELWHSEVDRSRQHVAAALASGGLDQLTIRKWPDGRSPSLRWVLVHMIEEYARHNGHADLLREAVDGETGE